LTRDKAFIFDVSVFDSSGAGTGATTP